MAYARRDRNLCERRDGESETVENQTTSLVRFKLIARSSVYPGPPTPPDSSSGVFFFFIALSIGIALADVIRTPTTTIVSIMTSTSVASPGGGGGSAEQVHLLLSDHLYSGIICVRIELKHTLSVYDRECRIALVRLCGQMDMDCTGREIQIPLCRSLRAQLILNPWCSVALSSPSNGSTM